MAQRLVRARRKIKNAAITFELPRDEMWPDRVSSILSVIYLVFNEGYAASTGQQPLRTDLCDEAIRLARMMVQLQPGQAEIEGLLALTLLNHSRRAGRSSTTDHLIPLERQDRRLWDQTLIAEANSLLARAFNRHRPGVYQLQAAISAAHARATSHEETRWHEIVLIYDGMHALSANPVYLLNRAVALSYAEAPQVALDALAPLERQLIDYQPFQATKADFRRRLGRSAKARSAYARAIALSGNDSERAFLEGRMTSTSS